VTRILAFGDSITAGTTSPALSSAYALTSGLPQSYPYKLGDLLTARYTSQAIETLNAGIAGRTAIEDVGRLGGALSEAQPEVLLLMEGANDLNQSAHLTGAELTTAVDRALGAIEDMVRDAQRRGAFVMLGTLPPQRAGGRRAGGVAILGRYNDGLKLLASRKDAHIVDVNAQFPLSLIGEDGLHPTEQGYDRLAEIFMEALIAKYETPATVAAAR
jgi:lysophospholipase L1-like esterase